MAAKQPATLAEHLQRKRELLAEAEATRAELLGADVPDDPAIDALEARIKTLNTHIDRGVAKLAAVESGAVEAEREAARKATRGRIAGRKALIAKKVCELFAHVEAIGPILAEIGALGADQAADLRTLTRTGDHRRDAQQSAASRHLATLEGLGAALAHAVYVSGLGRVGIPAEAWIEVVRPAMKPRPVVESIAEAHKRLDAIVERAAG